MPSLMVIHITACTRQQIPLPRTSQAHHFAADIVQICGTESTAFLSLATSWGAPRQPQTFSGSRESVSRCVSYYINIWYFCMGRPHLALVLCLLPQRIFNNSKTILGLLLHPFILTYFFCPERISRKYFFPL